MEVTSVGIPSRAVALLIESALHQNGVKFEINWDELQTFISVSSSDFKCLLDVENEFKQRCVTQTFCFHCACIPLFREEAVLNFLNLLEGNYGVKITLTEDYIRPVNIAHAINECGHDFSRQQIRSILVPRDTTTKPPVWYCCADKSVQVHELSAADSIHMEDMFRYGGMGITLLGEDYTINFKEMKMKSKSGKVLHLQRRPFLNQMLENQVLVHIHVPSLLSNVEGMHQDFLVLLGRMLVKTENIHWSCPSKFTSDMQQQLENFVKQFCVFFEFRVTDQVSSLSLEGAPGYVEVVHELVKKQVSHLEAYFLSSESGTMSVLQSSQPLMCFDPPPLWVPQTEKCIFCEVPQGSAEWTFILAQARVSMPSISLISVERIQNTVLWERYCLEEKHMRTRNLGETNQKFLFHGTSQTNPYKIAEGDFGVDFRYSKWNRPTLLWGTGAYFADKLKYSDDYAFKLFGGRKKVMLVGVLTGKSCYFGSQKQADLTKPPSYDSPTGAREYDTVSGKIHDTIVYTVYDHCKACPAYIVTY